MLVRQDDRGGREFERAARHFARIDRRLIDRAFGQHFVGDQLVLGVEEEHAEMLAWRIGHGEAAIGQELRPGADDRALREFGLGDALEHGLNELQILRDRRPRALDLGEARGFGAENARERAEAREQRLRQGLGVLARNGAEEQRLQQFIIRERVRAGLREARAQAGAMVMEMRL